MTVTDEEYKAEAKWPKYWIPVEKEHPCQGHPVFALTDEGVLMFGYYFRSGWITLRLKEDETITTATSDKVTHWSLIPILPGQENEPIPMICNLIPDFGEPNNMRFDDKDRKELAERFAMRDIKDELKLATEYQLVGYNRHADAEFNCWMAMTALERIKELEAEVKRLESGMGSAS